MNNDANVFASLLGGSRTTSKTSGDTSPKSQLRVTPGTMGMVREEKAVEAAKRAVAEEFAAKIADLEAALAKANAELESLHDETAAQQIVIAQFAAEKTSLQHIADEATANAAALSAENESLRATLAKPALDPAIAAENEMLKHALADAETASAARQNELQHEMDSLKMQLSEAHRTSLSSSVLLQKPDEIAENFFGEIRDHVLETLKDAADAASAAGRDRRAKILEAVLLANEPDGELESRRSEFRAALEAASVLMDKPTIDKLEAMGLKMLVQNGATKLLFGTAVISLPATDLDILRHF
ncbi:MAG: hypothetical protein IJ802_02665 [Kiritimatiellae bacterium]|nr:hypothetical protein [Kiritimatiellia bacterium]